MEISINAKNDSVTIKILRIFQETNMENRDNKKEFNTGKITTYWLDSSDKDCNTMDNLLKSKDYNWSLFLGHLVMEKLLRGCDNITFRG